MTSKDNPDLSPEKIGWLRHFENNQISDEELAEEVDEVFGKRDQKETTQESSTDSKPTTSRAQTETTSLQDQLKQASHPQTLKQTTFDDLLQIAPQTSPLSHYELEDTIDLPHRKGNGGWHKKKSSRERE